MRPPRAAKHGGILEWMRLPHALAFSGLLFGALPLHAAQPEGPPPGLNWQVMNEAVFDNPRKSSSTGSMERTFAEMIWGGFGTDPVYSSGLVPSGALIAMIKLPEDAAHVLSLFNRTDVCKKASSSGGAQDAVYDNCHARVLTLTSDGRERVKTFPMSYCHLNLVERDESRANHHTEAAVDARTRTVFLRTIQSGKVVPDCNRSIQLPK